MTEFSALCEELAKLALRSHYTCEDRWYSCPKSEDGCADYHAGVDCMCGTDDHNVKVNTILAALAALVGEFQPTPVKTVCHYTELRQTRIIEALETLAKETHTDVSIIVDQLIGHCFDEEEGSLIEGMLWGEKE